MLNKDTAYQKISSLAERFSLQYDSYKKTEYNETLTRRDFIDPFFKALGWDMDNEHGHAEAYREVMQEVRVRVSGRSKAPDYTFRLAGGKKLFFVEAKKPSVLIKEELPPAYQIRRYGWSAKLPVSIITDFEEFAVYDCTQKPNPTDKAGTARLRYFTFREYGKQDVFDFIWNSFSKEQVLKGGFDRFVQSDTYKKGTATVDKEFLHSLDTWRTYLATNLAENNRQLTEDEINFAVQQIIDRIIFLRIAEDRGVEPYGNLKECTGKGEYYENLLDLFRQADEKFNSGLFDAERDPLTRQLTVDNKVIKNIIADLYFPCPYAFEAMPVEILGTAYEQFLGKTIRITPSHHAKIEEKPEVRKAGGVFYTPQYIVDYIVKNTVGKFAPLPISGGSREITPEEVAKIKIVDPACGSGSFLLGAYQYLLEWHLQYYTKHPVRAKKDKALVPFPSGETGAGLSTHIKKKILLNNIYGVDIDSNAVEVTKLSLLLKCMEGETEASISHQMQMFHERVLPDLDSNIKCGNSLISDDYYDGQLFATEKKIKPFNWKKIFPEVFRLKPVNPDEELKYHFKKVGSLQEETSRLIKKRQTGAEEPTVEYGQDGGFDIVIGNPPYVRQELLGEQKNYFESHYRVYHGMADLYSYFIEKGIGLLNRNGLFGVIVANKWLRSNYGEPLRQFLKKQTLHEVVDFGDLPVFETATAYPCILIAGKPSGNLSFDATEVKTIEFESLQEYVQKHRKLIPKESLNDSGWNLVNEAEQNLLNKIKNAGIPLGEYVNGKIYYGIKTGFNEAFVIDEATKKRLIREDRKSAKLIKPFLAGRDIKRYRKPVSDKYLIFFPKGFTNETGNHPQNAWGWLEEKYPAIARYLKPFERECKKRFDKGDYWWELRACEYYGAFEKAKIIVPAIVKSASYTFDYEGFYSNDKTCIIPCDDKYLLGVISSKCLDFYLKSMAATKQGGYFEYKPMYVSKLPIKKAGKKEQKEISKLVERIFTLKEEKSAATLPSRAEEVQRQINYCEDKINEHVYEMYEVTREEINIIERE